MRSPASPQLELDGAGNMVNCSIKIEEKTESCYQSTQGEVTGAPPGSEKPHNSPSPLSEVTEPQTLPQVGQSLLASIFPPCLETGHSTFSALKAHKPGH